MRWRSVLGAGLVSGLGMNVLDFLTNGLLFGDAWTAAYAALGLQATPAIPLYWISFDFVNGVLIAFLYAAIRPRFGAGARAAVIAGLLSWTFVHLALFSHFADRVFPPAVLAGTGTLELLSSIVGALIAGRLYRESPPASSIVGTPV